MKKISLVVICALTALLFASCQTGKREDKNGNTPTSVVEKMYEAIQNNQFDEAASYCKIPDTIKMDEKHVYKEFDNGNFTKKDGKVIIGKEWSAFVVDKMKSESEEFKLDSCWVVSEEISKTDPNSAKVKTRIRVIKNGVTSESDCSFPLKRENDVWLIIG